MRNTKLHIAEAGRGKPLLLLHGWPQHWYVWRKVIPELSQNYRLLMPDLPGLGWSAMPNNKDFRKETLAEEILQLIDMLKLKQVGLIGHDWGGWIGFLACSKQPEKFNKFLALGIGYPFNRTNPSLMQYWRFLYQIPLATPFLGEHLVRLFPYITEWGMKQCAYQKDAWTKHELEVFSSILQRREKAQASSLLYRTFLTEELSHLSEYKKRKFQLPSLLLIGKNDPIINPVLFKNFNDDMVKIEIINNCGHFIPEEQSQAVIKAVRELF